MIELIKKNFKEKISILENSEHIFTNEENIKNISIKELLKIDSYNIYITLGYPYYMTEKGKSDTLHDLIKMMHKYILIKIDQDGFEKIIDINKFKYNNYLKISKLIGQYLLFNSLSEKSKKLLSNYAIKDPEIKLFKQFYFDDKIASISGEFGGDICSIM